MMNEDHGVSNSSIINHQSSLPRPLALSSTYVAPPTGPVEAEQHERGECPRAKHRGRLGRRVEELRRAEEADPRAPRGAARLHPRQGPELGRPPARHPAGDRALVRYGEPAPEP